MASRVFNWIRTHRGLQLKIAFDLFLTGILLSIWGFRPSALLIIGFDLVITVAQARK